MGVKTGTDDDRPGDIEAPVARSQPAQDPDPLLGAAVDGRYRIDRVIGRGGMAVVYAGEHLELRRAVAVKVLDENWASDADATERFLNEARTASSLTHSHIVSVSDLGRLPDGRPYLVMPLVAGADLTLLLAQEGRVPAHRVALLLKGVASALDLIHAKGLLHRDIKPENLMHVINEDGTENVLVLDFGIASARLKHNEKQGAWAGTPEFMPPETLRGEPYDHRADVYALATVAFELISGRLPFNNEDFSELVHNKLHRRPRTLAEAGGTVFHPTLEEVIARGLAASPKDRYRSAGELVAELEAVSAPLAQEPLARWSGQPRARRGRTLVRAGAAFDVSDGASGREPAELEARDTQQLPDAARSGAVTSVPTGRGKRPPLESGMRAIPTPADPSRAVAQDPWLYTWSLPKLDIGATVATDEPGPAEQAAVGSHSSKPAAVEDDDQAAVHTSGPPPARRSSRTIVLAGLLVLVAIPLVLKLSRSPGADAPSSRRRSASATELLSPSTWFVDSPSAEPEPMGAPNLGDEFVPASDRSPESSAARRIVARAARVTQLATRALSDGDLQEALARFDEATRIAPRYSAAWRGKGLVLDQLGRTRDAAEAFRTFLQLHPADDEATAIRKRLWQLSPR
jgi:hypothetical protein